MLSLFIAAYIGWRTENPSDSMLRETFNIATQIEFSESGKIFEKNASPGFMDDHTVFKFHVKNKSEYMKIKTQLVESKPNELFHRITISKNYNMYVITLRDENQEITVEHIN